MGACAPGGVQSVTRRGRAEEGGGERRGGCASLPTGLKREGICSFSLNPSRSTLPNNPFTLHTPSPPTLCPELEDMDKTFSIFTLITLHWLGRQTKTKRPARERRELLVVSVHLGFSTCVCIGGGGGGGLGGCRFGGGFKGESGGCLLQSSCDAALSRCTEKYLHTHPRVVWWFHFLSLFNFSHVPLYIFPCAYVICLFRPPPTHHHNLSHALSLPRLALVDLQ